MSEQNDDVAWVAFRDALEKTLGIPLRHYKEPQMRRRLGAIMMRHGTPNWTQFRAALQTDKALVDEIEQALTINVSEFFRQPDRFAELQNKVLPAMVAERGTLKIWSAGCSIGCEPYTLAMILNEVDSAGRHSVLATDVDMKILERARLGQDYTAADVRGVPPAVLRKYFEQTGETYRVTDQVKRRVTFRRHDLLADAYPQAMDIILCRNVVIYFNEDAKAHVMSSFAQALRPGGLLFIGGSEMIMRPAEIGLKNAASGFYQKAA